MIKEDAEEAETAVAFATADDRSVKGDRSVPLDESLQAWPVDEGVLAAEVTDCATGDVDTYRVLVMLIERLRDEHGSCWFANPLPPTSAHELPEVLLVEGLTDHFERVAAGENNDSRA